MQRRIIRNIEKIITSSKNTNILRTDPLTVERHGATFILICSFYHPLIECNFENGTEEIPEKRKALIVINIIDYSNHHCNRVLTATILSVTD